MLIRKATTADVPAADEIYGKAKAFMRANGNPDQWNGEYPNGDDVLSGVADGTSFVCEDNGEVVATFYFKTDADEPTYHRIDNGSWKSDEPYGVIHRIAVKHHGRGIIDFCFNECFKLQQNLRIDTHRDNAPMQRCLLRNGFEYCGIIYLESGDERLAYQKTR